MARSSTSCCLPAFTGWARWCLRGAAATSAFRLPVLAQVAGPKRPPLFHLFDNPAKIISDTSRSPGPNYTKATRAAEAVFVDIAGVIISLMNNQPSLDQLRAGRALLGLDQEPVARDAGISITTLRRVEAGTAQRIRFAGWQTRSAG